MGVEQPTQLPAEKQLREQINRTDGVLRERIAGSAARNRGVVFWLAALLVFVSSAPVATAQGQSPPSAKSSAAAADQETPEAEKSRRHRGTTFVSAPAQLKAILAGDQPSSLPQLQLMEGQQKKIADRAAECTVSVQMGRSQGCGVIVTPDGYVLTAAHVAMRANRDAQITLSDGTEVAAQTLGLNRSVDAGLIKIRSSTAPDGQPWPHATLGSSEQLRPGMWCVAMGHPGGFDGDRGVVARVGRILAVREGALVTDCALIGGDSGGPLFDLQGKLIGVHSRIGNDVADNLHVPIDHYDESWDRLASGDAWGFLPGFKPRLGVEGSDQTGQAKILGVKPGSAADSAGIREGDVILRFGDRDVADFEGLQSAVAETMPGERVEVRVLRDGEVFMLLVRIGRDPNS
jgi:S1-C subfamily serine protease